MAEKKRELWADYAKGICILLVFIGHSDAIPQAVRIFIYLFHMPMFFFCMGYYSSTAGTFGAFVKKRFRQLMVPFFAYGILYYVLCLGIVVLLLRGGADWALCRDNILGLLVQLRGTDLVAPKWFLTAAFVASVLFYALRKYVHDRRIEFPVVLAASAGFAYLNKFTGFSLLWYIDVTKKYQKTWIFAIFGVNPLFCYVLSEILYILADSLPLQEQNMHDIIYAGLSGWLGDNAFTSFVYAFLFVGVVWLV